MAVTYYVVVTFDRDREGVLKPGEAQGAKRQYRSAPGRRIDRDPCRSHCLRADGDPVTGKFHDAVILLQVGEVDLEALAG